MTKMTKINVFCRFEKIESGSLVTFVFMGCVLSARQIQ